MKRVVRAFTLFMASSMYAWLLFLSATAVSSFFMLRDSTTVKLWLDQSGVYSNVVDEVSKLATIQQKQENSLVQITSEDIQSAAKATFTPEGLQSDMEGVIDGFYGWFRGDTTGPEFSVDFASRQSLFATAMTVKLEQKIDTLPECANTGRFTVQAFDPFKADCRPKGIDLTQELASFEQELSESKDILPQVKYTGDDVKLHSGDVAEPKRIASALPWVPRAYKALIYGPWVIVGLTVISALVMIFMSTSRRKGVRRFAGGLLFTGIVLIVSGLFLRPAFERLNGWSTNTLGTQASFTQNLIDPIFKQINISYSRYSLIFGIAYTIPALITYGLLLITRHKKDEHEDEVVHESSLEPTPLTEAHGAVQREVSTEPVGEVTVPNVTLESPEQATSATASTPTTQPAPPPSRTYTRRPPMIQG